MIANRMHGSLGKNIKVHFAGAEEQIFYAAIKTADVKYRLYSCYKYIRKKKLGENFAMPEGHVLKRQDKEMKQCIQDSGLFTLMFGAEKGVNINLEFIIEWQDKLIEFVMQNGFNCTCVECDCQKVLGVKEAWFLRERMKKKLKNRQINVFHFEDGKNGLDSLIDFADYIAISVPELRLIKPKSFKEDTKQLVYYIKNKKPEIDIHLLGCTDFSMLAENKIATSADSTSWLQGIKYGYISDGKQKGHVKNFEKNIFEKRKKAVTEIIKQDHRHVFQIRCEFAVKDSDREIEIIIQQNKIKNFIKEKHGEPALFEEMSCEMIAEEIMSYFKRCRSCEVLEDGYGGAKITR